MKNLLVIGVLSAATLVHLLTGDMDRDALWLAMFGMTCVTIGGCFTGAYIFGRMEPKLAELEALLPDEEAA